MDYDWKIKQFEEEARHEKAMRELQGQRLDTHDRHFEAIHTALEAIRLRLETITGIQEKTEAMLRDLVTTIAREHTNGKTAR